MKITDVRTHLVTAPWDADPWFPQCLFATALVRIETDGGHDGLGEATLGYFAPDVVPALVDWFKPVLVGEDPMDIERLTAAMLQSGIFWARAGAGRSVISGVELALWDLKGKVLGVPVYALLGGKVRDRIPVYASAGPAHWPPEENVRKFQHYAALGFRAGKIAPPLDYHALRPAPAELGACVREVDPPIPFAERLDRIATTFDTLRRAFGGDFELAADGHQAEVPDPIHASEAIEIAAALAPYRLRFYEEPLPYTDVDGYRDLRARSRIPVAGGECLCGLDQFHVLVAGKGLDVVQPDPGFVGGLGETLRIIHHAEAHGLSAAIHTGASFGPVLAASWHLAAAVRSVEWLEMVAATHAIHRETMVEAPSPVDGALGLPGGPGLGLRITPEFLARYPFVPNSGERT